MDRDEIVNHLIDRIVDQQSVIEREVAVLERIDDKLERVARSDEKRETSIEAMLPEIKVAIDGMKTALVELKGDIRVLVDNVKDVEKKSDETKIAAVDAKHAAENMSGPFPRQELDVDDTDKAIGKIVRGLAKTEYVRTTVLVGGGSGLGAGLHWLAQHLWRK